MIEALRDGLRSGVDAAVGIDPRHLARVEVVAAYVAVEEARRRLEAFGAALLGRIDADGIYADDLHASAGTLIAVECRLSRSEANLRVKRSRQLRALPESARAFAAGTIGVEHVAEVASVVNERTYPALLADEAALVTIAARTSFSEFRGRVARWGREQDQDGGHDPGTDASSLYVSSGMWGRLVVKGDFSAADATVLRPILEAEAERVFRQEQSDRELDPALAPLRSASERNAEALVNLLTVAAAADPALPGAGATAAIGLVVTAEELDARTGAHRIDDDHAVPVGEFDHLGCDAAFYRAVLGSDRELLELGRSVRSATAPQKRALAVRDRGCVVPGCDRPPRDCQAHHVSWYRDGGRSDIGNLALVCRRHHRQIHARAWSMRVLDDQRFVFTRNDGTELRKPIAA